MHKRLESIKAMMTRENLDAFLISGRTSTFYFTGFSGTTSKCLFTRDGVYLITDFRYVSQAKEQVFTDIEVVRYEKDMMETLNGLCLQHRVKRLGIEGEMLTYSEYRAIRRALKQEIVLDDRQGAINRLRMVKDAEEMEKIAQAANIADTVFHNILPLIKPGVTEYEMAMEMEYGMKKLGAKEASFDTIVASGPRSALPHGVAGARALQMGDAIVLDFGAVYQGYCSDMTRTVFLGTPSPQMKSIYDIVQKAQKEALNQAAPGMKGMELDGVARDVIRQEGYGKFFGHGLGHGVGVDIHELPAISPKGKEVLKPGMVFTVEPGIYLEGVGGVRIEDMICLTESGVEIFSKSTKECIIL